MSLVVDFVLLGGTNLVLVIWGLIHEVNSVFRQILPRTASFTSRYNFSYKALARQSRLSVNPFPQVKSAEHMAKINTNIIRQSRLSAY